jgi:diguanylate cyclase (GGDEF)-like protein
VRASKTEPTPAGLRGYAALAQRFFIRNYMYRVVLIAFVGTHVPLLTLLIWVLTAGQTRVSSLFALLVLMFTATQIGFGLTLYLLNVMLAPIRLTTRALEANLKDGSLPHLPTHFADEVGALMRGVQHTIERLEMNIVQLTALSEIDALTGAYNRSVCQQRLIKELAAAARGEAVVLALIDLDDLKGINDTHGHIAGDVALRLVTRAISDATRGADWVARWGGDEFILVLRDTPISNAKWVFQRVIHELKTNPLKVSGSSVALTLSIGATQIGDVDTVEGAFERADALLYSVKNDGRDGFRISDP